MKIPIPFGRMFGNSRPATRPVPPRPRTPIINELGVKYPFGSPNAGIEASIIKKPSTVPQTMGAIRNFRDVMGITPKQPMIPANVSIAPPVGPVANGFSQDLRDRAALGVNAMGSNERLRGGVNANMATLKKEQAAALAEATDRANRQAAALELKTAPAKIAADADKTVAKIRKDQEIASKMLEGINARTLENMKEIHDDMVLKNKGEFLNTPEGNLRYAREIDKVLRQAIIDGNMEQIKAASEMMKARLEAMAELAGKNTSVNTKVKRYDGQGRPLDMTQNTTTGNLTELPTDQQLGGQVSQQDVDGNGLKDNHDIWLRQISSTMRDPKAPLADQQAAQKTLEILKKIYSPEVIDRTMKNLESLYSKTP